MVSIEIFMAVLIAAIVFLVCSIVLSSCFAYHKDVIRQLREPVYGPEISLEELNELVSKFYNEPSKSLEDMFIDFLNDKNQPRLGSNSTGDVEILSECEGHNCPCHPTREDCCSSTDGKCHIVINLNKLCNVEDIIKDPSLLTEEEVKLLTVAIQSLNKD